MSRPGGPGAGVLFEWGRPGAQAAGGPASALVIVDVLSFSTAVTIAAGERWPGDELRPALEDLLGAGAIIAALSPDRTRTAEAAAAEVLWRACREHAGEFLAGCTSGQELTAAGYAGDITLAAEHDIQDVVPVLTGSAFLNHVPHRGQG